MVKRTGVVCVLVAVLVGALIAPAAHGRTKQVTRDASVSYELPWMGNRIAGGCGSFNDVGNPCPRLPITRSERWVTMEINDDSGTPAGFSIHQVTPDGTELVGGPFCGSTGDKPVKLMPGRTVLVKVYATGDVLCPGAFGTSGSVEAVFSNTP